MSMMTIEQIVNHPHALTALKCALINAIPVLFYSIWASTFLEDLEEPAGAENDGGFDRLERDEKQDPATQRVESVRMIRIVYTFTLVGQILAYMICFEIAPLPHHLGWVLFVCGLLTQSQIKNALERRVRKTEATESQHLGMTLKSLFFVVFMLGVYTAIVHVTALGFLSVAELLKFSKEAAVVSRIVGTFTGVFLAVFAAFALAPWYLRRLLPVTKLTDSATIAALDQCFLSAGLVPPEFWLLELDNFGMHNALITGLLNGRGPLRPALFLSRSLVRDFPQAELHAVVLHEVSHLKLKHIRSRFLTTFFALVGSCILAALIIGVSIMLLSKEQMILPMLFAALLPAFSPYFVARTQVRRHELEADAYAVFSLGADLEALGSALKRIDKLNDLPSDRKDPTSVLSAETAHPTTELRISVLRAERVRRLGTPAAADDSSAKAA